MSDGGNKQKFIELGGVKQNNLKNISVKIPLNSFTVICGPSGSGKSSLAFETLYAEGQRRYIESLSNYARQFLNKAPKPDIETIKNIPPAIAIEQKNSVKTSRSTVGTTTEITDYLRLLFEKLGVAHCPTHHVPCVSGSVTHATDQVLEKFAGKRGYILAPITSSRLAEGKKLLNVFLKEGFQRIYIPPQVKAKKTSAKKSKKKAPETATVTHAVQDGQMGEVIEIGPKNLPSDEVIAGDFFVVIDRVGFREEDRGRLADSISQAYHVAQSFNLSLASGEAQVVTTDGEFLLLSEQSSCPICGYKAPLISSKLFSFNSPVGACPTCNGFGNILILDEQKIIPNPKLSLAQGAISPFTMPSASHDRRTLNAYLKKAKIDPHTPWEDLPAKHREMIWKGNEDFFGVEGLFEYLETKKYKMHVRVFLSRFKSAFTCTSCNGTRLRQEAQYILIDDMNITQMSSLTVEELYKKLSRIELSAHQKKFAGEVLKQIVSRLKFLIDVGVTYLTLDRETRTLSGGEYQRLNLANQLGMGLSQTLYVLDEPTVGLHPRDNDRLIRILKQLKSLGNTLVIVEHDHDVIRNSEHVIEMGPGSGHLGGEVLFSGQRKEFFDFDKSNTVRFLKPQKTWTPLVIPRPIDLLNYRYKLELTNCRGHNLKNVNVSIPLNRLVTVTGVSGSGKSTLVSGTLYPAVARALDVEYLKGQPHDKLSGVEHIKNVLFIDQSPIGKSARSSPVTYLKIFDNIRTLMAGTPESQARGYTAGTFSLNVDGGRCPVCKGMGVEVVDMAFMDNVEIPCDACDGKRYRPEILEVQYNRKNIDQILKLTVQEAMDFFVSHPNIRKPLSFLKEVGLDYMTLGQSASSLSGGESQRLKIAREFISTQQKATLYILDEPTTGLHFREVDLLMKVLGKLIEAGGSVVLVEHNLDVISSSDYVIDLGPEAGEGGGQIVFEGTPEDLMKVDTHTGRFLKTYVEQKSQAKS